MIFLVLLQKLNTKLTIKSSRLRRTVKQPIECIIRRIRAAQRVVVGPYILRLSYLFSTSTHLLCEFAEQPEPIRQRCISCWDVGLSLQRTHTFHRSSILYILHEVTKSTRFLIPSPLCIHHYRLQHFK